MTDDYERLTDMVDAGAIDLRQASDAELESIIALTKRSTTGSVRAEIVRVLRRIHRRTEIGGPVSREANARQRVATNIDAVREATEAAQRLPTAKPTPKIARPIATEPPEPVPNVIPIDAPAGERKPLTGKEWISQRGRSKWSIAKALSDEVF